MLQQAAFSFSACQQDGWLAAVACKMAQRLSQKWQWSWYYHRFMAGQPAVASTPS